MLPRFGMLPVFVSPTSIRSFCVLTFFSLSKPALSSTHNARVKVFNLFLRFVFPWLLSSQPFFSRKSSFSLSFSFSPKTRVALTSQTIEWYQTYFLSHGAFRATTFKVLKRLNGRLQDEKDRIARIWQWNNSSLNGLKALYFKLNFAQEKLILASYFCSHKNLWPNRSSIKFYNASEDFL